MKSFLTLAAALAVAFCGSAWAQDWYGALHLGKGWKSPAHLEHSVLAAGLFPFDFEADLDYDSGFGFGVSVGRSFSDNWRLEAELGYRKSKIGGFEMTDVVTDGLPPTITFEDVKLFVEDNVDISGKAKLLTGSLNLYYDLPIEWAVRPYVGAGMGVVRASKQKTVTVMPPLGQDTGSDSGKEWDFKWQAMAGAKYSVNERWETALGWRYTDLKGLSFELANEMRNGEPSFMGGAPLVVKKNGMHTVELTIIRRF